MSNIKPGFIWTAPEGYNSLAAGGWKFDEMLPPTAPAISNLDDGANVGRFDRLGRPPVIDMDFRPDGVRTDPPKKLTLHWPRGIDLRFGQYLHYKHVFALPMVIDIPLFSPVDPEIAYTPNDNDAQYLLTYYGRQRWWKAGSVSVWADGDIVSTDDYAIDYTGGTVTFNTKQLSKPEVRVQYIYSAPFVIVSMQHHFIPNVVPPHIAPEISIQEVNITL